MNYYDEIVIKCSKCHKQIVVFPRNERYFKCYKCGAKTKDKEYQEIINEYKYRRNKYEF